MKKEIAVIGGGAAGLFAAIHAARTNKAIKVKVYERMDRVGKKILATGNGRCNFTNKNILIENYHGKNNNFAQYALEKFNNEKTIDFFSSIGILSKEGTSGKIYPYSMQASSVLDALRNEVIRLNIEIITESDIKEILNYKGQFKIKTHNKLYSASAVIMALGGKASSNLGSNGSGYKIMEKLGHKTTKLSPALVQIKTSSDAVKGLNGIKINAKAYLYKGKKYISSEIGEILFTNYGLSGPPIFQLSALAQSDGMSVLIDLMPEYSFEEIYKMLLERKKLLSHLLSDSFFNGMINKKIGMMILKKSGVYKLSLPVCDISNETLKKACENIKNFSFDIKGLNGFENAQVTAGGLETNMFNCKTMESKIIKGLYAAGEIFDIYGDCGGYNLQWAWSSGYIAGVNAALSMR